MSLFFQILFGLYPVVVKKFAVSTKEKANAYIFTFYRYQFNLI